MEVCRGGRQCVFKGSRHRHQSSGYLQSPTWTPLHVHIPCRVVTHRPKTAAMAPATHNRSTAGGDQGTKILFPRVLVSYLEGNVFPEAPSRPLLMSHGHSLTSHRQIMIRMSRLAWSNHPLFSGSMHFSKNESLVTKEREGMTVGWDNQKIRHVKSSLDAPSPVTCLSPCPLPPHQELVRT